MKHFYLLIVFLILSIKPIFAQQEIEQEAIKSTINLLFDGMRNSDTTMIKKAFAAKNIMQTIVNTNDGKFVVRQEALANFIKSVATPHPQKYDEQIVFTKILIDANLASVWTAYRFFIGDKFSHCGVNSFQLFKNEEGWKIIYLIDTRRKDNCN